jgi:hypothetical protein
MAGKCPKCGNLVASVTLNEVSVNTIGMIWRGVTYSCQSCNSVLSVGIDPVSLKSDLVDEIAALLHKR